MSKKHTIPNYPINDLETEIERLIMSFDEDGVLRFASDPVQFLDEKFDPTEIQFLVTQRLSTISKAFINHSIQTKDSSRRTLGDKIISSLVNQLDTIFDLSKLREDSRGQFVNTLTSLGEFASLKDRNYLATVLSKLSGQLTIEENIAIAKFIGDTFKTFPHGNKSGSSIAFRRVVNEIFAREFELSSEEQEVIHETFSAITQIGNEHDVEKALRNIGKIINLTPEFFGENLKTIESALKSSQQNNSEFSELVASHCGRIAQGLRDFSLDLSEDEFSEQIARVETIFTLLAKDSDPEVRISLVDEMGFAIERLHNIEHNLDGIVEILRQDLNPGVQGAFARQLERGFLSSPTTMPFGK